MPEKIVAYSLDVRPRVLTRTGREFFKAAGEEDKFVVSTNEGAYIEREFVPHVVHAMNAMNRVGLPVPQGVLLNPGRGFMLVPDLKADGSELYGKNLGLVLETEEFVRHRPRPEIDRIFLNLTSRENFPKLEASAKAIFDLANRHEIEMPFDDPLELMVHPDGTWEFICVDVEQAVFFPVQSDRERAIRRDHNQESYDRVIAGLDTLRYHLLDS